MTVLADLEDSWKEECDQCPSAALDCQCFVFWKLERVPNSRLMDICVHVGALSGSGVVNRRFPDTYPAGPKSHMICKWRLPMEGFLPNAHHYYRWSPSLGSSRADLSLMSRRSPGQLPASDCLTDP